MGKSVSATQNDEKYLYSAVAHNSSGGNKTLKPTQIPDDDAVFYRLRDFVNSKRNSCSHIFAPQVPKFMLEENIISIPAQKDGSHTKSDYDTAIRSLQRY